MWGDFLSYLRRANRLEEAAFARIEEQVLEAPFLSLSEHYEVFTREHPKVSLCEQTFRRYISRIDSVKLLKRVRRLVSWGAVRVERGTYLKELLATLELKGAKRREILRLFPEVEPEEKEGIEGALERKPPTLLAIGGACNPEGKALRPAKEEPSEPEKSKLPMLLLVMFL